MNPKHLNTPEFLSLSYCTYKYGLFYLLTVIEVSMMIALWLKNPKSISQSFMCSGCDSVLLQWILSFLK